MTIEQGAALRAKGRLWAVFLQVKAANSWKPDLITISQLDETGGWPVT
ncbi:hypothetical protein [Rhodophyticola sp. CCM32]|nr:hypothetical protein [Rhodophyticola sp. CCM32]